MKKLILLLLLVPAPLWAGIVFDNGNFIPSATCGTTSCGTTVTTTVGDEVIMTVNHLGSVSAETCKDSNNVSLTLQSTASQSGLVSSLYEYIAPSPGGTISYTCTWTGAQTTSIAVTTYDIAGLGTFGTAIGITAQSGTSSTPTWNGALTHTGDLVVCSLNDTTTTMSVVNGTTNMRQQISANSARQTIADTQYGVTGSSVNVTGTATITTWNEPCVELVFTPAATGINYVNSAVIDATTCGGSVTTCTLTYTPTSGNKLIFWSNHNGAVTGETCTQGGTGMTAQSTVTNTTILMTTLYEATAASSSSTSFTCSWTTARTTNMAIIEYSVAGGTFGTSVGGITTSGASGSTISLSYTLTHANDFLVGCLCSSSSATTQLSLQQGMTRTVNNFGAIRSAYGDQSANGTTSVTLGSNLTNLSFNIAAIELVFTPSGTGNTPGQPWVIQQ